MVNGYLLVPMDGVGGGTSVHVKRPGGGPWVLRYIKPDGSEEITLVGGQEYTFGVVDQEV